MGGMFCNPAGHTTLAKGRGGGGLQGGSGVRGEGGPRRPIRLLSNLYLCSIPPSIS